MTIPKLDLTAVKGLISRLVSWIRGIFTKGIQPYWMQQREYRERCVKLVLYYQGVQVQYLMQLINVTAPRSAEELKKYIDIQNITQYITDSVAQTFKYGVQIDAVNKDDQEIYNAIIKENKFGAFIQSLEGMLFLLKQLYIKVYWSEITGLPKLEMILPQFVDVIPDSNDSHKIGMIAYPASYSMNLGQIIPTGQFHVWTKDAYGFIGQDGMPLQGMPTLDDTVAGDKQQPNPYGVVPIITIRAKLPTTPDFFMWPGAELEYAQDNINMDLTFLRYIRTMQSWGVPVLYGADALVSADKSATARATPIVCYSPSTPIQFSQVPKEFKTGLEFVSPAAKIAELEEGIEKALQRIYAHFGLDSQGQMPTRSVKAADTLQMENSKLEEYRDRMKEVFGFAIKDIFDMITLIYNKHADKQLSGEGVSVTFLESDVSKLSVADKIAETTFDLEQNIKSIVDVYIEESDDDLTPDEAEKQIVENAEINARIKRAVNALNPQPAAPQMQLVGPDGQPAKPGTPGAKMAPQPAPTDGNGAPAETPASEGDQAALDEIRNRVVQKKEVFVPTAKEANAEADNEDQVMRNASDHRLSLA